MVEEEEEVKWENQDSGFVCLVIAHDLQMLTFMNSMHVNERDCRSCSMSLSRPRTEAQVVFHFSTSL